MGLGTGLGKGIGAGGGAGSGGVITRSGRDTTIPPAMAHSPGTRSALEGASDPMSVRALETSPRRGMDLDPEKYDVDPTEELSH